MRVYPFIFPDTTAILDVGCNVGALIGELSRRHPQARLAGVEINATALEVARRNHPSADIRHSGAEAIPFPDASFDVVTCVEVLEHLPEPLRPAAFREMRRVLRPGGRLVMTVPHDGWFAWLDSNNVRFRLPGLYRAVVGRGRRDANYDAKGRTVEWHHHFTLAELHSLLGPGWRWVSVQHGGLFLYPLMDWLSWPFYRTNRVEHPVRKFFERVGGWDYAVDFGSASYGILIALERGDDDVATPSPTKASLSGPSR